MDGEGRLGCQVIWWFAGLRSWRLGGSAGRRWRQVDEVEWLGGGRRGYGGGVLVVQFRFASGNLV